MSASTKPTRVTRVLNEHDITKAELAEAWGMTLVQVSNYVCGARKLNTIQRRILRHNHPASADEVIEAFDYVRTVYTTKPITSTPARSLSVPRAERVDASDYYPITEWKRLFGEPGGGARLDTTGRIQGCHSAFFPTEPDYCEDAA